MGISKYKIYDIKNNKYINKNEIYNKLKTNFY